MREAQRIEGLPVPNQKQGVVDLYDVSDDWIPIYDKNVGFYSRLREINPDSSFSVIG
jgi:sarcosine oxidase subunit beta